MKRGVVNQVPEADAEAAEDYLLRFNIQAIATLRQYQEGAEKVINCQVKEEPLKLTNQHHQLELLNALLDNLNQELNRVARN